MANTPLFLEDGSQHVFRTQFRRMRKVEKREAMIDCFTNFEGPG